MISQVRTDLVETTRLGRPARARRESAGYTLEIALIYYALKSSHDASCLEAAQTGSGTGTAFGIGDGGEYGHGCGNGHGLSPCNVR